MVDRLRWSIGVEEEWLVVRPDTWHPVDLPDVVLIDLRSATSPHSFDRDYLRPQLEARSSPHTSLSSLRSELVNNRRTALERLANHGLVALPCGAAPMLPEIDPEVSPGERNLLTRALIGLPSRTLLVCSTQFHVRWDGLSPSGPEPTRLRWIAPILLALSASSPFFLGRWTGFHAGRLTAWDALPFTGPPPATHWSSPAPEPFGPSRTWWDFRWNHRHGTIEMRIADQIADVDRLLAVAALLLLAVLDPTPQAPDDPRSYHYNRWSAMRHGCRAELLFGRDRQPLADVVSDYVERSARVAERLGLAEHLSSLNDQAQLRSTTDELLALPEFGMLSLQHAGAPLTRSMVDAVCQHLASHLVRTDR